MIDTKTGRICFDGCFSVAPWTVSDDLCDFVDMEKDKIIENGPWKTFLVKNMSIAGHPIALYISFQNDRISSLHLSCLSEHTSWEDYTAAHESDIKSKNDKMLEELFGKKTPQRFPWGRVESLFDQKTGDAKIIIQYDVKSS